MNDGIQVSSRFYSFATLATKLTTGSVHDAGVWQTDTVRLVVMRWPPAFLRDAAHGDRWSPGIAFAPTMELLRAYRNKQIAWEGFAERYLRRLGQMTSREAVWNSLLLPALWYAPTVTLLCAERGDEETVCCHRRLLRSWLLGEEGRA